MRPKRYKNYTLVTIGLDQKDIDFLDDHRGKVARGEYLREGMYSLKGETSETLKNLIEKTKQQSKNIEELKRQLLFERSRNNKPHHAIDIIDTSDIENKRTEYYNSHNITQIIERMGIDNNGWNSISSKNLILFKDSKTAKDWILDHYNKTKNPEIEVT